MIPTREHVLLKSTSNQPNEFSPRGLNKWQRLTRVVGETTQKLSNKSVSEGDVNVVRAHGTSLAWLGLLS